MLSRLGTRLAGLELALLVVQGVVVFLDLAVRHVDELRWTIDSVDYEWIEDLVDVMD